MSSGNVHPCLSVAIIVRNAAEPLAETLESIRHLADEIIIVDTGSTDETQAVAQQYKLKCYPLPWQDNFAAARNHAAQLCAGDWILWLDAGERLSPEAAEGLRTFVNTQADPTNAYMMVVRVPAQPNEIAGEQIGAIRLMPNDPALKFTGRLRETLVPALAMANMQVEGLPFRIDRGLRELDREVKTRRAQRNIQLADLSLRERGPQAGLLLAMGDGFHTLGQNERAAQYYRQAISLAEAGSSEALAGYYGLIMALETSDQGRAAQLSACVAALDVFPLDAQLLCASGGYLQSLGQLEMATKAYETAYRFGRVNPEVWHLDGIVEIATACYCQALDQQGKTAEALATLEKEVAANPTSMRLHKLLLSMHVQQGNRKAAIAEVDRLPPETPYLDALKEAVRGACLAVAGNWIPARAFLESAYRNGSRDPICLLWYSRALAEAKEWSTLIPVLAQWRTLDPHHPDLTRLLALATQGVEDGSQTNIKPVGSKVPPPRGITSPLATPTAASAVI